MRDRLSASLSIAKISGYQLITAYIYPTLILLADDKLPTLDRTICAITEGMLNIIKS